MPEPVQDETTERWGLGMAIAAFLLGLALLTVIFDGVLDHRQNPNQAVQAVAGSDGVPELVLERNAYGHYVASGRINGEPVTFMVDTGASDVSVPAHLARRLGLKGGTPMTYNTANGPVMGYRTVIDSIDIGGLRLHDVLGSLNPGMQGDEVLLGMSVLKRLEFSQQGRELILRPPSR